MLLAFHQIMVAIRGSALEGVPVVASVIPSGPILRVEQAEMQNIVSACLKDLAKGNGIGRPAQRAPVARASGGSATKSWALSGINRRLSSVLRLIGACSKLLISSIVRGVAWLIGAYSISISITINSHSNSSSAAVDISVPYRCARISEYCHCWLFI